MSFLLNHYSLKIFFLYKELGQSGHGCQYIYYCFNGLNESKKTVAKSNNIFNTVLLGLVFVNKNEYNKVNLQLNLTC